MIRIGHCREMGMPGYDPKLKGFLRIVAGFVGCRYFETNVRDGQIYILAPRTTKAKKGGITRKEYNRVTRSIEDLLYPITGINIDMYKERKRKQSPAEEPAFVTQ